MKKIEGGKTDIQPYIDPDFQNNIILTQTERLTMSSRPPKPQYARNKNVVVIGGSGYRIKALNTINFSKSMHYNPFVYIRSEKDVLKLVNTLIANTKGDGEKSNEDFWVKAERLLYCRWWATFGMRSQPKK